ncbi:FAD-dependent oxidoreductase [Pseudonocardia oroxyli]|uniref:FAD binding domain-containing protein n=1 Tax=Pseudonocardia oroxyli TaxID=366584 RepID=A0A1G7Y0H5_PSEOR|nr:FAD-dependent oxidoreductase [Pseudonocardia oroxyli]SDG89901.1 FAD binding domain-containing protein [Pseudonocardia oroxyli]
MSDNDIDLLVVGGGMAGLTAAARAASRGASVVVVESADAVGGSGLFAGFLWSAPTHEVMNEINPEGDPALRARLVDDFGAATDWLRELDVPFADAVTVLRYGRGHQFDTSRYVAACAQTVRAHGELLLRATVTELLQESGTVVGAVVATDGGMRTVGARRTLLATGGFQADAGLRAELRSGRRRRG